MDNDFEHLHEVEHSQKKQCGKSVQLTDFFKPASNKIRTTLRERDGNTAHISRTGHDLSINQDTNVSCVADVTTTKAVGRTRRKPGKDEQCITKADIRNNTLVDACAVAAKMEVEEISYSDFLKQKNSYSDVGDAEESEIGDDDNNMASPSKLTKLSSNSDQEMFTNHVGNTDIVQPRQGDEVTETSDKPKTPKNKKTVSNHSPGCGDVERDRQDEKSNVNRENDDTADDKMLSLKSSKGCCAITSFFLPSSKRFLPAKPKQRDTDEVIVQAEVHVPSAQSPLSDGDKKHKISTEFGREKPANNHKGLKCNAVADNVDLAITHLETVYVAVDDVDCKQNKHVYIKCQSGASGNRQASSAKKKSLIKIGQMSLTKEQVESAKNVSDEEPAPTQRLLRMDRKSGSSEETRTKQARVMLSEKSCRQEEFVLDVDNVAIDSSTNNISESGHEVNSTEGKSSDKRHSPGGKFTVKDKPEVEDEQANLTQNMISKRLRNSSTSSDGMQVLSQTYRSTLINPTKHKKGALKIKFTRVIDHDNDKESFTRKPSSKRKVNAANELLQKAKSSMKSRMSTKQKVVKLKPSKSTSKGSTSKKPVRRSSRVSSQNASLTIQHLSEVTTNAKKRSCKETVKSKKPKKSHDAETKKPAVKRKQEEKENIKNKPSTAVKIAPVFSKIFQPAEVISGKKDVELSEEEKQAKYKRDTFLRSGIPQTMKKHLATEHTMSITEYAPIPKISHVQQITEMPEANICHLEDTLNMIKFQVREEESDYALKTSCNKTDLAMLTNSRLKHSSKPVNKEMSFRPDITEEMIPYMLAEISTSNPLFPVHQVYTQLLLKKKLEINSLSVEDPLTENENKQPKGKKRKNQIESETCSQRKRQKQVADVKTRCDDTLSQSNSQLTKDDPLTDGVSKCHNNNNNNGMSAVEHGNESVIDLLWTEKYSPSDSSQILGNSSAVKKVASWLREWKKRTDLGTKQHLKKMRADGKYKEQSAEYSCHDYDFEDDGISSDASDDDCLCNTMLITGPYSSGKTCIIYALAQELGYKVFEVNAASQRSGKQILSQLQEATQSHQVSNTNATDLNETSENKGTKTAHSPGEKKMSKAFTNFFKTSSAEKKEQKSENDLPGKKGSPSARKTQKQNKLKSKADVSRKECHGLEQLNNTKKGLNLSSTSLIVFDEADLVFEQDKGFWFAIETFISTTKRPILLTASDPHFKQNLNRKIEHVSLKQPTQNDLASYLQLICLIENMRTSFHQLCALVSTYNSDLRRLLLSLQFWAESGGSSYPCPADVCYNKEYLKDISPAQSRDSVDSDINKSSHVAALTKKRNDSEIENQKLATHKSRESLRDTRSTKQHGYNVLDIGDSPGSRVQCSQEGISSELEPLVTWTPDDNAPLLEDMLFYSVTGGSHYIENWQPNSSGLEVFLQENELQLNRSLHSYYLDQGIDFVHANITQLLNLPNVMVTATKRDCSGYTLCNKPTVTGCLEDLSQVFTSDELATVEVTSQVENISGDSAKEDPRQKNTDHKLSGLVTDSLTELASVFEAFSFVDSHLTHHKNDVEGSCVSEEFQPRSGCLISGQLDDEVLSDSNYPVSDISSELSALVSLGYVNAANRKLESVMHHVQSLEDNIKQHATELIAIPTEHTTQRLYVKDAQSLALNDAHSLSHGANKVMQLLSYTGPRTSVATDYLPTVRTICRSEQFRMATGRKRRFLHYLNGFVTQITDTTLSMLCSSLQ